MESEEAVNINEMLPVEIPELLRQLDIHFRRTGENDPGKAGSITTAATGRPASVDDPNAPWHLVRVGACGVTVVDSIRGHDREDAISNARWNWFVATKYPSDWIEYLALDDNSCDGSGVLWTGGFLGKPNTSVTCPDCGGTGKQ